MKKQLLLIFFAIPFLVISCSKDDDNTEVEETGKVTVEGTEYTLIYGELFQGQYDNTSGHGFDIVLISSDPGVEIENLTFFDFVMQMEFYSEDPDDIKPGTYTYDEKGDGSAGTFGVGVFAVGWDDDSWEATAFYFPTGGTFEVDKEGDYYYLTFNVITDKHDGSEPLGGDLVESGVSITGNFQGKLEQNYSF